MAKEWIVSEEDLGCDGAYFSYNELVRCKDCKHQRVFEYTDKRFKNPIRQVYGCDLSEDSHVCLDDDFCSRGERKEE